MKTNNKSLTGSWRIFRLIFAGGLAYLGLAQLFSSYSASELQRAPLTLEVAMVPQSRSTSCGEAVITMVYNYAHPQTPIHEQQVIDYAAAQGYYTEDIPPFTSPANMVKIAEYFAEDVSNGTVLSSDQGLTLLIQKLKKGQPVVIDVLSNFNDPDSEAHFVVVTGISVDASRGDAVVVNYNDPLTGTFESADWDGTAGLWNAWQNNDDPGGSGWWLVISPPQ